MNFKSVFILVLLLFISKIGFGYKSISDEHLLVSMRKIGDQLLLKNNDSTSRVLPIEKSDSYTYVITFEKPISFDPVELVDIVHQNLQEAEVPLTYIVEVHNLEDDKVIYSYSVNNSLEESSIPCLERNPPPGHYYIKIFLESLRADDSKLSVAQFAIPIFLLFGLIAIIVLKKRPFPIKETTRPEVYPTTEVTSVKIGAMDFCMINCILSYKNKRIELSSKEAKLLKIFATSQNTIIDRNRLLKEVWEDEGVFVGRSLDVFISKLRKKIKIEPNARLVNIHGRGYKLEVCPIP